MSIVCKTCKDTHMVFSYSYGRDILCTDCPLPCEKCRKGGVGAYCETPMCTCQCHKHYKFRMKWEDKMSGQVFDFNDNQAKEMAIFTAQLVREGVKFSVRSIIGGWKITVS